MGQDATKQIGFKEAKDRLLQEHGEVIFEGEASAYRAAGGRGAVRHDAHTRTAGPEALDHYHPVASASTHAFVRGTERIVIPGAVIGTSLFGDNLFGQAVDFVNPLSDVQDFADIADKQIMPAILGFVDKYLMRPPKREPEPKELKPVITVKLCFEIGNCEPQ